MSFLSKLTERVIVDSLLSHRPISAHNFLSKFQSAYCRLRFCETVLLRVQNNIFISLDAGRSTALLLLDLSAAFDAIDHNILLHHIQYWFDFSSTALNVLSSYPSGRSLIFVTSKLKSQPNLLVYGVPQGSA